MKYITLIAALITNTAQAQYFTGSELLSRLNSSDAYMRGSAMGYIASVHDVNREVLRCFPKEVQLGKLRDEVKAHLESTPEIHYLPADLFVTHVITNMSRCNKESK